MPFQAIPIAMRKNTGSPLAKLLLIYLMNECSLLKADVIGAAVNESATYNLIPGEAARFCQCDLKQLFEALEVLDKLGFAFPDPQWLHHNKTQLRDRRDEWEFMLVRLPFSDRVADERKRIKASDDQLAELTHAANYRCAACGRTEEEFGSRWAVDHIIPRSVGGADVEENCQAICSDCNSRKGAKVHWVDFLGGRR